MIIICGKSGSGKTSVVNELVKLGFRKAITDTTRPVRPGEINGVDYNFLSQEEFNRNKKENLYAESYDYTGAWGACSYGSRKELYTDKNEKSVIILNPFGLEQVKNNLPEDESASITTIYLKMDDDVLYRRLSIRGDDPNEIERRLKSDEKDFKGLEQKIDFIIEVSARNSLEDVLQAVLNIIQKGERK